jgi:PPK2 family polyphosphate:nucleotide phosphotransferase
MLDEDRIEELRVPPGTAPRLDERAADDRLDLPGKKRTRETLGEDAEHLAALQYRLWAERRRSVLLVLQGMDASGKDGVVRRVFSGLNPAGVRVTAFAAPEGSELAHDYLWRIHAAAPPRGYLGVFNRSHYEDLVTAPLVGAVDAEVADRRIAHVVAFERMLVDEGTAVVKVFLHLSREEQRRRLRDRILDPDKGWKFSESDVAARARWEEYRARYERVIERTSTKHAPWYVVPADHKWVRDAVVSALMRRALERLDPSPPPPPPELARLRELMEAASAEDG